MARTRSASWRMGRPTLKAATMVCWLSGVRVTLPACHVARYWSRRATFSVKSRTRLAWGALKVRLFVLIDDRPHDQVFLEINARLITILPAAAGMPPRSGNPQILRSRNSRTGERDRVVYKNTQYLQGEPDCRAPETLDERRAWPAGGVPETKMWTRRSIAVIPRCNGQTAGAGDRVHELPPDPGVVGAPIGNVEEKSPSARRRRYPPTTTQTGGIESGHTRPNRPNQRREAGGQVSGCQGNVGDAACATSEFLTMQQLAPLWRSKTVARLNPARLPRPFFLKRRKPGS